MPRFEKEMCFARPLAEVFDFFCRTANLVRLAPPELHLRLVEGPERLHLGARLIFKGRRWGTPHRVASEITSFEPEKLIVDEQRQGPFGKWIHTHTFAAIAAGTRVQDAIDYEPPGGMLGLVVRAGMLERELEWVFAYRAEKLRELLGD